MKTHSSPSEPPSQKNKTVKLIVGTLIGSAVVSCMYGGYLHAQNTAQESSDYQSTVVDPISPDPGIRAQAQQRYIDRAKLLRDHWQKWAYSNRSVLHRLVNAEPTDIAALQAAYNAVPTDPTENKNISGITDADLDAPGANYTWQAYANGPIEAGPDPGSQQKMDLPDQTVSGKHPVTRGVKSDFAKYRDIDICDSINTGRLRYTLWASGRVTEITEMDKFMGHGKPILLYDSEPKELYPSYDFVEKTK